MMMEQR